MALEIAKGGPLMDAIAMSGRFEEPVARYFFKQLVNGLNHMHQNGVVHRAVRPENILLDEQLRLKIADLGSSAPVAGRDGRGLLKTIIDTAHYMAPEMHLKVPYSGKKCDLFAAGILLFTMVAAHPPFATAQLEDPFYKCFYNGKEDLFWKTHCSTKLGCDSFFSADFKDMMTKMLKPEPTDRLTLTEMLRHPWMLG